MKAGNFSYSSLFLFLLPSRVSGFDIRNGPIFLIFFQWCGILDKDVFKNDTFFSRPEDNRIRIVADFFKYTFH